MSLYKLPFQISKKTLCDRVYKYEKLEKENEQLKEALKHALNIVYQKYDSIDSFKAHWGKEYNLVYDD